MVRTEEYVARMVEPRGQALLYEPDLEGKRLQASERTFRLVQIVNLILQYVSEIFQLLTFYLIVNRASRPRPYELNF